MKIAVIAANGRTGREFVSAALESGHNIRAGVHGQNPFAPHPKLKVINCDATKQSDVANLIEGQEAVVSLIGHTRGSATDVQTQAIKLAIQNMDKMRIKRLISLTGTGVRFAGDKMTLIDRFLNFGVSLVDKARVTDGQAHVELIKNSGLNWTIIRVLKLQNTIPKAYRLTTGGPAKVIVSRAEVAQAILEVLEKNSYITNYLLQAAAHSFSSTIGKC